MYQSLLITYNSCSNFIKEVYSAKDIISLLPLLEPILIAVLNQWLKVLLSRIKSLVVLFIWSII